VTFALTSCTMARLPSYKPLPLVLARLMTLVRVGIP
jgi:hypothetical protein